MVEHQPSRILVVDDNPSIHRDFQKIFGRETQEAGDDPAGVFLGNDRGVEEPYEYSITSAFQGIEAVEIVQDAMQNDDPFVLAFIDMRMPPGWDGLRTIRELWKIDDQLQVVICTAYSDHSWRDVQCQLGRTDKLLILKKPFDNMEVKQLAVSLSEKWHLQRKLQSALDQAVVASEAKTAFVATMSHELRTPLNGILGMTQLLAETDLTDHQKTLLEACQSSGETLLSIIGNILDVSRIEAGRSELELESTDLATLVEGVTQAIGSDIVTKKPNVDLVCYVDPEIPKGLDVDAGKLRQILFNLIGNAAKFTEVGNITVRANCLEQDAEQITIEFSVKDTGIGIPSDRLKTLFDAFSQIDASHTREFEGSGLGLYICNRFIELMGGSIKVTSKLRVGSEFSFTLTLNPTDLSKNSVNGRESWARDLRVATVGFSARTHQLIAEMLQSKGMYCERLLILRQNDPVPNLTDFNAVLVDSGGSESRLRSIIARLWRGPFKPELRVIPVVDVGQAISDELREQLGIERPLTKPIFQSRMFRALRECIYSVDDPATNPAQKSGDLPANVHLGETNQNLARRRQRHQPAVRQESLRLRRLRV